MASLPDHVLQVRNAIVTLRANFDAGLAGAAIAWLQGDMPQPVDGYIFRLETERTPLHLGGAPRWRYVLNYARVSLQAHDFEWQQLIQVEA